MHHDGGLWKVGHHVAFEQIDSQGVGEMYAGTIMEILIVGDSFHMTISQPCHM